MLVLTVQILNCKVFLLFCPTLSCVSVCTVVVVGLQAGAGRGHTERCGSFLDQRGRDGGSSILVVKLVC